MSTTLMKVLNEKHPLYIFGDALLGFHLVPLQKYIQDSFLGTRKRNGVAVCLDQFPLLTKLFPLA